MFPLDYRNEIEITHIDASKLAVFQEQVLIKASEELRRVKGREIKIEDNKVSFSGGLFRFVDNWNILAQIGSGQIEVVSSPKGLAVTYLISFKQLFLLGTILIFIAGISMFPKMSMPTVQKVFFLFAIWLFLVGGNWLIAMIRFPGFVKSIIRKAGIQRII
jgi:hypothetical protein